MSEVTFGYLLEEQRAVQADKHQGRTLEEYDLYIFPGQWRRKALPSAISEFVLPFCDTPYASIEGILGEKVCTSETTVHWVDIGGGRGLSQREINARPDLPDSIQTTLVDIFDYELDGLADAEMKYIENKVPGITAPEAKPRVMIADAETVQLDEKADLLTSVEVMQYLHNPIKALANWYNQLKDDGLMLIATEHDWSTWIRFRDKEQMFVYDNYPMQNFLRCLGNAGIKFAATYEADWENGHRPNTDNAMFSRLAIQKLPGTNLEIDTEIFDVWHNPQNYKAVYYRYLEEEPVINVN